MASKKSRKPGSRSQTVDGTSGAGSVGRRARSYRPNPVEPPIAREVLTPVEHYRREKSRREEERRGAVADPLEEARREYRALLAADAAKQKGGRPK